MLKSCYLVIFEKLQQFLAGTMFFEMKQYKHHEFLFERQLQRDCKGVISDAIPLNGSKNLYRKLLYQIDL